MMIPDERMLVGYPSVCMNMLQVLSFVVTGACPSFVMFLLSLLLLIVVGIIVTGVHACV